MNELIALGQHPAESLCHSISAVRDLSHEQLYAFQRTKGKVGEGGSAWGLEHVADLGTEPWGTAAAGALPQVLGTHPPLCPLPSLPPHSVGRSRAIPGTCGRIPAMASGNCCLCSCQVVCVLVTVMTSKAKYGRSDNIKMCTCCCGQVLLPAILVSHASGAGHDSGKVYPTGTAGGTSPYPPSPRSAKGTVL